MRVFPDANIFVANFLWKGVCSKVLEFVLAEKDLELVIGAWVWEETRRTLHRKFRVPISLIGEYEALIFAEDIKWQRTPLALAPYLVEDPDDRVVLSCALSAGADVLITGDGALLQLATTILEAENLLICTPGDFLNSRESRY